MNGPSLVQCGGTKEAYFTVAFKKVTEVVVYFCSPEEEPAEFSRDTKLTDTI